MAQVFLGLGSNIGNRLWYLKRAIEAICKIEQAKAVGISSVYETEPVGYKEQNKFLNLVIELDTQIEPIELLVILQQIEYALGRCKRERWGPREIDIDILLYGEMIVRTSSLTIPHPELEHRRFVLIPLSEIAPGAIHPVHKKTIAELLQQCPDSSGVVKTNQRLL